MENELKEEVYKCSKCGLCQSVCPIYLSLKNEMYLPRGRYITLNNFFNNKKNISKQFVKNLDICLNCNLCKKFCPSGIDSYKIFTALKSQFNYKYGFFRFSFLYKISLNVLKICSFLYKIFPLKSILKKTYAYELFDIKIKRKKPIKNNLCKEKVILFEGCFNHYINSSDKNAAINILESLGYNVIIPKFQCCGYPDLSEGNIYKFKQNSKKIIEILKTDCKYLICTCDSCFDSLNKISDYFPEYKTLLRKIKTLDSFLETENYKIKDNTAFVYHKPLIKESKCYLPESIEIINKKGSCTLMENFFRMKNKKISKLIEKSVCYKEDELKNRTIITTCQLSKWGLTKLLKKLKINSKAVSYAEFINLQDK